MPDSNCTEFEARLMQAVENRESLCGDFEEESAALPTVWQDLRAQAHRCPHCRQLWNEFALLDRVLPVWKEHLPPVDLADVVLAKWRAETSHASQAEPSKTHTSPQRSTRWSRQVVLLLAALTVLLCFPLFFRQNPEEDLPPTQEVATSIPSETTLPPLPATETATDETDADLDWQSAAKDAGSAYWALASQTADSFASVTVFVPAPKAAQTPPKPPEPKPASGWMEGIGTGLKPIGKDVGHAIGFLLEALPGDSPTL